MIIIATSGCTKSTPNNFSDDKPIDIETKKDSEHLSNDKPTDIETKESIEKVLSIIKESQNLDPDHPVHYSLQEKDEVIGYGQMEYIDKSNNNVSLTVYKCNSSESLDSCSIQLINQSVIAAEQKQNSAIVFDLGIDKVHINELVIYDGEKRRDHHFFWKHDSQFIIQQDIVCPSSDPYNYLEVEDFIESISEDPKSNADTHEKISCAKGATGFPLISGTVPLKHYIIPDGKLRIMLENNLGKDAVITSISCSNENCNNGWSGEQNIKDGETTRINEIDFVNIKNANECYSLHTTIEYKSNGVTMKSSGKLNGAYE